MRSDHSTKDAIRSLLAAQGSVTNREVRALTGLTSAGVYYHLREMVDSGELIAESGGRGARYRRRAEFVRRYEIAGLAEEEVWTELVSILRGRVGDGTERILHYAVTEMVNNAIDHSSSDDVTVSLWFRDGAAVVEVADRGIGAFRHVANKLGLADELQAIQELSKGKTTTMPERHTGEGIFFTSRAVDVFAIECNGWRWTVDNPRSDQAVGESLIQGGTTVTLEIEVRSSRRLAQVFEAYTIDMRFGRSRTRVQLFEAGTRFVSRSEARRVARGLERFDEVLVDFDGVEDVGQGFVDELLRVWAAEHPGVSLEPVNMSRPIEAMVRRGIPEWRTSPMKPGLAFTVATVADGGVQTAIVWDATAHDSVSGDEDGAVEEGPEKKSEE